MLSQHLVQVDGVFGPGSKGARPGEVVPLGSIGLNVLSVAFHGRLPEGTLRMHQSILPCNNGAFSTIQHPLPNEELHLQLGSPADVVTRRPTPTHK
jgi:hypothetical protein